MNETYADDFAEEFGDLDGAEDVGSFEAVESAGGYEVEALDGEGADAEEAADALAEFLSATPALSASEQAELLGATALGSVERYGRGGHSSRRGFNRRQPSGGGFDFGGLARAVGQIGSLVQAGAQIGGQIAGAAAGNDRTRRDIQRWTNLIGTGAGAIGGLARSFQRGPVPAMPRARQPVSRRRPRTVGRGPAPRRPMIRRPGPVPRRGTQQMNATGLLSVLMSNPQILQALRAAPVQGRAGAREVILSVPGVEDLAVPLGAVVNTLSHLAQESMAELNALTSEQDPDVPEYLVDTDGEFRVDPANAEERAALVLELVRIDSEARRWATSDEEDENDFEATEWEATSNGAFADSSEDLRSVSDPAEAFAQEAGFLE